MAYKVFYPNKVKKSREISDDDPVEQVYEDMTQMEDRLNSWMHFAGELTQTCKQWSDKSPSLRHIAGEAIHLIVKINTFI